MNSLRSWFTSPRRILTWVFCLLANIALAFGAWNGSKPAIIFLAVFSTFFLVMFTFSQDLVDDVLDTSKDCLDGWKKESKLAQGLADDYASLLSVYAEHDPAGAAIYLARYQGHFKERYPDVGKVVLKGADAN